MATGPSNNFGVHVETGHVNLRDINNYHGAAKEPDLPQAAKDALINSLRFSSMDRRYDNVRENAPRTCEWLLETPDWLEWQSSFDRVRHRRMLWIKGHAGTGKSTCMKFAAEHARRDEAFEHDRIITHFFNARARETLESSLEGMYRTVLVQVLEGLTPDKVKEVAPRQTFAANHDWALGTLSNLFKKAIREYKRQPITCFIDALDECDDEQVADMVKTFSDVVDTRGSHFRVCFSSRHYPNIVASEGLARELILDRQPDHLMDIEAYIQKYLLISNTAFAHFVRQEVKRKARGIFIWCELVVDILNKEWQRGRLNQPAALSQKLDSLPAGLHDLFEAILSPSYESPHRSSETLICFQWNLYAYDKQNEKAITMWWAIQRGTRPDVRPEELEAEFEGISRDDLRKYIVDVSKGLIETYTTGDGELALQLIHESARDFLLKEGGLACLMGVKRIGDETWDEDEIKARSHEKLKEICLNEGFRSNTNLDVPTSWKTDNNRKDLFFWMRRNRLAIYAHNVLWHAQEAHREGNCDLDQTSFLEDFRRQTFLEQREKLHYLQWHADDQHYNGDFTHDSRLTLTDVLIRSDAGALLQAYYSHQRENGSAESENFGLDPSAAWSNPRYNQLYEPRGYGNILRSLFTIHLKRHQQDQSRQAALRLLEQNIDFEEWADKILFRKGTPIIAIATLSECLGVFFVVALLPSSWDAGHLLDTWSTTWSETCGMNKCFGSFLLLVLTRMSKTEAESILDLEDTLCWAAEKGFEALVQLLLDQFGVSPNATKAVVNYPGQSALLIAVSFYQAHIVKILLSRDGIEPDGRGPSPSNYSPLTQAVHQARFRNKNNTEIIEMLLDTGRVDIENPMVWALTGNMPELVDMLRNSRMQVQGSCQ